MTRRLEELTVGADDDVPGPMETTQRVNLPSFDDSTRAGWQPYRFDKLERLTQTQVMLAERMAELLPGVAADGVVPAELLSRLHELLDAELTLKIDYVHVVKPEHLKRYVGAPTFLGIIAPLPHKPRGLLEVELGLAHKAIDLLLGGPGEMLGLRALTEIEEGVMSYLVLETLKALSPHADPGLPKLRLEGIARKVDEALGLFSDEAHVGVVQLKAALAGHIGYVRVLVPESVLRMATGLAPGSERAERHVHRQRAHLARLAGVKAWLRVDIGNTEITSSALSALSPKDVLVLDALTAFPHRGEGGTATLRVGLGRAGCLEGEVFVENEKLFAKVTGFALGDTQPAPSTPGQGEEDAADALSEDDGEDEIDEDSHVDEDSNEGAELLSDIPLQIAVELARVPVTAEEVLSLKVGQVFDLQRVPGEPVDLSVGGKVVARGELVEVDGHLGVRILTLLR